MFEQLETRALLSAVVGSQTLNSFTITGNVGEKPESKLWNHDGHWWGVFSDSIGTHVWRLDGLTWTKTFKITTLKGIQVDVKSDGNVTHVLFENNLASQLYSLQYVPGSAPTYALWGDRPTPASVKLAASVEAATIDIDSNDRMWVGYDDNKTNIEVRYSDAPYSTWSNPIVLANNVDDNDLAALTAIPNGTVGVLWGNQTTTQFGFRTHVDGTDPTLWTADELPASQSALNIPDGFADGHINLAVASDATLYAAIKTGYHTVGSPEMGILVRRPNGVWDDFHDLHIPDGTRPIIQLNEVANTLIFSYDNDSNWVYHECNAKTIVCSGPTILLSEGDNGSSTKQNVITDLVIVTSGKGTSGKLWGGLLKFDVLNSAPVVNAGPNQSIFDTQSANLLGVVGDDGRPGPAALTTTWSKFSGPGPVLFTDATAKNTSASFSVVGEYVLELVANDGELSSSDTVTILVSPPPTNLAPSVNVGNDITVGVAQTPLLHGSVSDDGLPFVPGSITTHWSRVSGTGTVVFGDEAAVDTTVTFSEVGDYTLRLTAFDGALTGSDEIVVTIILSPPNQAPVVNAGNDQTIAVGSPAALNGSFIDDNQPVPLESVVTTWSQVSGPGIVSFLNASSLQASAVFSQLGTYVLELSASDTELTGTDTITITISDTPVTKSFQDGALPTVVYAGTRDTKLRADNRTTNYGKNNKLEIDGNPDFTSLLQWDVSDIQPGATVLGASFTVNVENTSVNSFKIYELVRDWVETEATFLQSGKNVLWNTPGAAGIGNDRGSTVLGLITAPKQGLMTVELNEAGIAAVQKWVSDPASNHGLVLQDFTNAFTDDLDFTSREGSKPSRPKLTVRYLPASSPTAPSPLRTSSLNNVDNPLDVNADTQVTPLDALIVINSLSRGSPEGEEGVTSPTYFPDVSGDGIVSPLDALLVINHLNEPDLALGEGEGTSQDLLVVATGIFEVPHRLIGLASPQYHSRPEFAATAPSSVLLTIDASDGGPPPHPRRHDAARFDWDFTAENESMLDAIGDERLANSVVNELASDDPRADFFAVLANDN